MGWLLLVELVVAVPGGGCSEVVLLHVVHEGLDGVVFLGGETTGLLELFLGLGPIAGDVELEGGLVGVEELLSV